MDGQLSFEFEQRKPIKGYPELHWTGKRPYTSTQYYPAQLKESYGEPKDGWMNKIFWGDNLQVMSHLLREYRGKVKLVYIDPPFDSKTDYKLQIKTRNKVIQNDISSFEEKQYSDIWTNDEYLQFIYERLTIIKELLSSDGSFYLHCDWHRVHSLKCICDEIFGIENFKSEIIWKKTTKTTNFNNFGSEHDTILYYAMNRGTELFQQSYMPLKESELITKYIYLERPDGEIIKLNKAQREGKEKLPEGRRFRGVPLLNMNQNRPNLMYEFLGHTRVWATSKDKMEKLYEDNMIFQIEGGLPQKKGYLDENPGAKVNDMWIDINPINSQAKEKTDYPTQKPEELLSRIIYTSTQEGDLVFDCFMGSGTTQAVAMKLGRRFIGADINLGAIQTTTKRLIKIAEYGEPNWYKGFEVYNVNNYDFFRNPVEAKELLIDALGIQKYDSSSVYDGEMDGWMVKIMPTNRIATKADLEELKANLPYHTFEKRKEENPNGVVEKIRIICMGHEADLKASLEQELSAYKLEIEILDILRDKTDLQFKREADANVVKENNTVAIKEFYPMNLLQKLSMQKESVDDWRQLVESIYIDWNYDGETMRPAVCDIPGKDELVSGVYEIPSSATRIKIKITDLLSESLELEV